MASDLLMIGRSGAQTSRIALEVTAQNIANASTEGYVRRSVGLEEVAATGGTGTIADVSLSGVRLDRVIRNADLFRQAEVRRTGADAARAGAEVAGLENIESAVEQSGVFDAIVRFEGALQQLVGDPTSSSLRASTIEQARTMAGTFNIASSSLDAVGTGLRFEAGDAVAQVNTLAQELAGVNLRLSRAADATSDQSALLDQRDSLLQKLSGYTDVATEIDPANGTVKVRIGGASDPLVEGGTARTLAMTTAANGTVAFDLSGAPLTLTGGALAGKAQALVKLADIHGQLDTIAVSLMGTINAAQQAGAALDGSAGQPMFAGTSAATMSLVLADGSAIATAAAGSPAGSRDATNLGAMRTALAWTNPAGAMDGLLFDISGTVAGRKVTREALDTIASGARISLAAQAGVDLDTEATNLIRYQQAFQASGRVMQTAKDIFDTLLNIR